MLQPMNPNQHIEDYLDFYLDLPINGPSYAVLLNGPWGIGKSYFVKDYLQRQKSEKTDFDYVFVSLYGITSSSEIDDALFCEIYPKLNNKFVGAAEKLGRAVLKKFAVDPGIKVSDLLDVQADVYVFDDLERCRMPICEILGYINHLVEHEHKKVIVIANEEKISTDEQYKEIREKLIGKTFEVQSVYEDVLQKFIRSIPDKDCRDFLTDGLADVAHVFEASRCNNLRLLQQSIWDFERLFCSLEQRHRGSKEAMRDLLRLYLSLSLEVKAGRIFEKDLSERQSAAILEHYYSGKEGHESSNFAKATQRYKDINLTSTVLSDESLTNLLVKGLINPDRLSEELDASSYFIEVAQEPAWRTVWYMFERTESQFLSALESMEKEFFDRGFTVLGEILHVFGLRLWLSSFQVLQIDRNQVVKQCEEYIDDLYTSRRLTPWFDSRTGFVDTYGSYAGLGIHENSSADYQKVRSHLISTCQKVGIEQIPTMADQLLQDLQATPVSALERMSGYANSDDLATYRLPILAAIKSNSFVDMLLAQHPAEQRRIFAALQVRYQGNTLTGTLKDELPWIKELQINLIESAKKLSNVTKYRIERLFEWHLKEAITLAESVQADVTGI